MSRYLYAALVAIILALCQVTMNGCAYNSVTITAEGNVTCNASVDKPVSVRTDAQLTAIP